MASKSRFQIRNVGRKGKPCWVIYEGEEKLSFSSRSKSITQGFCMTLRRLERQQKKEVDAQNQTNGSTP